MSKVIMSQRKIQSYQHRIIETPECQVTNLTNEAVARLSGAMDFGIVVNEVNVRAEPTDEPLYAMQKKSAISCEDRRQLSSFSVGEGVWILQEFESPGDHRHWLYVQGKNYAGWIHAFCVGRCCFEEMKAYLTTKNFVIVTTSADIKNIHFAMGSRLLKCEATKDSCAGILCPISVDGKLKYMELSKDKYNINNAKADGVQLHEGYLIMTPKNIVCQAKKLLGTPYRWGNLNGGLDCSGVMTAVYACFGLTLPRDSGRMIHCPLYTKNIMQMNSEEKKKQILQVYPGSLLFFSGHVMMYIGMEKNQMEQNQIKQNQIEKCQIEKYQMQSRVYILHALTRYMNDHGEECPIYQCTITPLELVRPNGETYMESLTHLCAFGDNTNSHFCG